MTSSVLAIQSYPGIPAVMQQDPVLALLYLCHCGGAGLIPGLAQWVKDQALLVV